jgi:hypothetical protein
MNDTLIRLENWCKILGIKTNQRGEVLKVFKGDNLDVDAEDVQEVFRNAVGNTIIVTEYDDLWYVVAST